MQELEGPLECRTVAPSRKLGNDEREDHVAELIVLARASPQLRSPPGEVNRPAPCRERAN
jgi:hypothetical protein